MDKWIDDALAGITETSSPQDIRTGLQRVAELLRGQDELSIRLVAKHVKKQLKGVVEPNDIDFALLPPASPEPPRTFWPDDQPSSSGVRIAELLDEISGKFSRHMVLPEGAADALALWAAHTYAFDRFPISPYLGIMSATKGCGKTTLFQILAAFAWHPFNVANANPANIFRMIEKWHPTLLLDEGDTYIRGNDELRGILNGGHAKSSAVVVRCVGDDHEPTFFSTWGPKAFALIGRLPSTLEDRSVRILLRRKTKMQHVEPLDAEELEAFAKRVRSGLLRWAEDKKSSPLVLRPTLPDFLVNRAADNWRPLFSIAEDAGEDWPQRAREAASLLMASPEEDEDIVTMLLRDLKIIFGNRGEIVYTAEILADLTENENRPWREYDRAGEITPTKLAELLKHFRVESRKMRREDQNRWGYRASWFKDIFAAYFPEPEQTEQMEQENEEPINEGESIEQTLEN